jgi:predicted site-specific integrase-resolvase
MADFTAIITSFCARLYSRRRAEHKKKSIEDIIRQDS